MLKRLTALVLFLAALLPMASAAEHLPANHPPIGSTTGPSADAMSKAIELQAQQTRHLQSQDRSEFQKNVHIDRLRTLAIFHQDHLKIMDSWARQSLRTMSRTASLQGADHLYNALDIAFVPELWQNRDFLYIQAVPIRQQLASLIQDPAESQRLMSKGRVSPAFLERQEVRDLLEQISSSDVRLASSVNLIVNAYQTYQSQAMSLQILPPGPRETLWHLPLEARGNIPALARATNNDGSKTPALDGYSEIQARKIILGMENLQTGWRENKVELANSGIDMLASILPMVQPEQYPSETLRSLELWYNRSFNGTLVGFVYFIALTLFLLAAVGAVPAVRRAGLAFYTIALTLHLAAMLVRWSLAGRIPIQNQFESVLGSALVGCLIGLGLEWKMKNAIFGLALSFVGFLSMTACFVVPFVYGTDMGASIGNVAGVLNDFWLYVHVNIVICSYALIGASFFLGLLYLSIYFLRKPTDGPSVGSRLLEQLDASNQVVLQMAFWLLGIGIICGAVWADHSWGRPWGWDPKETFALVTWIVYLIIVHIRFVTRNDANHPYNRANWTAALSIVGFAVMLFNWIGVNFFLAGLHSYA